MGTDTRDYAGERETVLPTVGGGMATCPYPHCGEPLALAVESAAVPVYRGESSRTIEPDAFTCRSCDAALFATVSRELADL